MKLPSALHNFFKGTERCISELYRPAWLLSDLDDTRWVIGGANDIRTVSGVLKGGTRVSWNKKLSAGSFTDPQYAVVLEQSKLI